MKIKVVTFNMHHAQGTDGKLDLNRIAGIIEESDADLIGLNEVDRYFSRRSGFVDQVSWLGDRLKLYHAFGASVSLKPTAEGLRREYGNATLSRYPITQSKNHLFNFYSGIIEGRALLEIDVKTETELLKVYVTHLSINPLLHRRQTEFIVNRIPNDGQPVIMLGDWNMKPRTRAWRKITEHLSDVCDQPGNPPLYTFPSNHPRLQLDYIFVSPHISVASVEVITSNTVASDHLPLQAILHL